MKNSKEVKAILTAIFAINRTDEHADKDISLILDYAFRRLFGANTNLLLLACLGKTKEQIMPEVMLDRHEREQKAAIAADKTGDGYICQMFLAELADHECCIAYDYEDTFNALGLTVETINSDKRLLHGLRKATKEYLKHCEDY